VTRPATALDVAVEFAGALPVPLGHARPIIPAPSIEAVDVPVADLEAPTHTTPEEGLS
jgi:hypothetical protein